MTLPKRLTYGARKRPLHQVSAFRSRKASPSIRIFSRFFSPHAPQHPDLAQKWRQSAAPNPLTVTFHVIVAATAANHDRSGGGLPHPLTLAQQSRIASIPNPLTFFPAPAHPSSRSPSPDFPAPAHPGSRKASPDRPKTPARYRFAMALTFLTGIKGVYFYDSQAQ